MTQYNVTGMSCAACSARVEKAVSGVEGVTSCSVNLLTNSMGVEGTATPDTIIKAVVDAGYGASVKGSLFANNTPVGRNAFSSEGSPAESLKDTESPQILKRVLCSLVFLLPLMYIAMGHKMWKWPVPAFLANPVSICLMQLLLAAVVMIINQKFFINGFKGLIHGAPNMDTLVALGSMASFSYSTVMLFGLYDFMVEPVGFMPDLYFESAAMILVLISFGKFLEALSKGRTTNALKGLMKLAPTTAVLEKDGQEVTVPIDAVKVGDIFILRPGDRIPVDGVVLEGRAALDESTLTGESLPVEVNPGDGVTGSCINTDGFLKCRATRVGEDTSYAKIIRLVSDAAATKAPIAKLADKVSGVFVPAVITIALITFASWLLFGQSFGYALTKAVSVLVISCPCALGLATPVAIMVGNGVSAKNGILFKTAISLEETGKLQIIALDKTGTITCGTPGVTGVFPAENIPENFLLSYAYALEKKSEHPLAKAVTAFSEGKSLDFYETSDFQIFPGNGLSAKVLVAPAKVCPGNASFSEKYGGKGWAPSHIYAGNQEFIEKYATVPSSLVSKARKLSSKGETPLFFAGDSNVLGIISVSDIIREDSAEAVKELKNLGLHVVMLTGDTYRTAQAIGEKAGVDEVIAEVKPADKAHIIEMLKAHGKVAMVGDGVNDAPALTVADIGIAVKSGTDIAMDSADVILMKNSLKDAAAAIRLSRHTLLNIKENLFWAFFYNVICIPLAAGVWVSLFGLSLNPMVGAAAMSLSSFCVVTNALRLNLVKIHANRKDKPVKNAVGHEPLLEINNKPMEDEEMTINVKGMMCHHCEMHVEKALMKLEGVEAAKADHTNGTVTITTTVEVSMDAIKAAVEDAGYEMVQNTTHTP